MGITTKSETSLRFEPVEGKPFCFRAYVNGKLWHPRHRLERTPEK